MFQRTLYLLVETLCPPRLSALPPQAGVDPLASACAARGGRCAINSNFFFL